jgi:hypothetical protein
VVQTSSDGRSVTGVNPFAPVSQAASDLYMRLALVTVDAVDFVAKTVDVRFWLWSDIHGTANVGRINYELTSQFDDFSGETTPLSSINPLHEICELDGNIMDTFLDQGVPWPFDATDDQTIIVTVKTSWNKLNVSTVPLDDVVDVAEDISSGSFIRVIHKITPAADPRRNLLADEVSHTDVLVIPITSGMLSGDEYTYLTDFSAPDFYVYELASQGTRITYVPSTRTWGAPPPISVTSAPNALVIAISESGNTMFENYAVFTNPFYYYQAAAEAPVTPTTPPLDPVADGIVHTVTLTGGMHAPSVFTYYETQGDNLVYRFDPDPLNDILYNTATNLWADGPSSNSLNTNYSFPWWVEQANGQVVIKAGTGATFGSFADPYYV